MKKMLLALCSLACIGLAPVAGAADAAKAPTPQQERMKNCNKEAGEKGLKGDERKGFMKTCLSGKTADAPAANAECQSKAVEKKLAGAAKASFIKKCEADVQAAK